MASDTSKVDLGYVGETYVMAKLIREYSIASVKVPQQFFPYDLITSNHKRLEVKTARPMKKERRHPKKTYKWFVWQFTRKPRQILRADTSDFVVCVGFRSHDLSEEPVCFIIPSDRLTNPKTQRPKEVWSIKVKTEPGKHYIYQEYKGRWDLIASQTRDLRKYS